MTDLKAWDLKQNSINPPLLASAGRGQRKKIMITREEAKEFLPIIQAFAEGKTIQVQENEGYWRDADVLHFNYDTCRYRIKPEPKYRPFNSAEECWQEMQKHQPFGWLKSDDPNIGFVLINQVAENQRNNDELLIWYAGSSQDTAEEMFRFLTFADGSVFGVKEEGV